MSIADYVGRRYDVLAFRGATPSGTAPLSQTLVGAEAYGEICVGIQKLTQRWLLEFLNVRGSTRYEPTRGTRFMREYYAGNLRTEVDVQTIFDFAELEAANNLRLEETADMPDDERLDFAELMNIAILPDLLQLTVGVVSLAGSSRKVIMPLGHTV